MRKISFLIMLILLALSINISKQLVLADDDNYYDTSVYSIYDEDMNLLFQKDIVKVGDNYLSKDFNFYEVVYVDDDNFTGFAKFLYKKELPKVEKNNLPTRINIEDRVICMYMTHNDESYVLSDGVDSVYGNGGIKDVALAFKSALENNMIEVHFDDTLHIPHDTQAYSRSQKTAKSLQNTYKPDALFDIHRDGASRKFYVTTVDGKEKARVRMVIGKANPNMALNEEFAMYLMSVGNELYPWLFTDIYYATGHYNQALDSKAILFEMGSHLVEKELVIDSMDELAEVVTKTLYATTVDSNSGEITINGSPNKDNVVVNEILDSKEKTNSGLLAVSIVVVLVAAIIINLVVIFYNKYKKNISKQ